MTVATMFLITLIAFLTIVTIEIIGLKIYYDGSIIVKIIKRIKEEREEPEIMTQAEWDEMCEKGWIK